ncbi:MAG: DUF881 domain-containing protein [Firmicutes bacterium]|jgi:uncharacterized protein YlxW (UPF0749 family)|nr:DUF881 domain-containing protein [Bacillota bacterium]
MARESRQGPWRKLDPWLTALIIVIVVNVIVLARSAELLGRPGKATEVEAVRQGAVALGDFYSTQIKEQGLEANAAVREAMAKYRFEAEQAMTRDEIAQAVSIHGRNLADVIQRERELKREQVVLDIVRGEPGISTAKEGATITVQVESGKVLIEDPEDLLSQATEEKLKTNSQVRELMGIAQIQVRNGKARLLTTRSLPAQVHTLRQEINAAQTALEQAMQTGGFAELTGPGLVIKARQSRGQALIENVLGYDLRDIVNELFAAGARGIQVGSERLIATSSIRAVGEGILVNHHAVSTQPIEVRVVGDPKVLASALDLITHSPYFGLVLDVEKKETVTLVAHPFD